jgi:uncharacterized protein
MDPRLAAALVLSTLIGASLGLLGSGGSIVTLPVLVYVAGIPTYSAITLSLAIVGGTSLAGCLLQWRNGRVDFKPLALFSVTGIAGSYIGAQFTRLVPPEWLMLIFAAIMLVVGGAMLRGPRLTEEQDLRCRPIRCGAVGMAVGLLTGFIGVGGGFLIVPALVLAAGLDMKVAVGTSLGVIAFNSVSGLVGHLRATDPDWKLAAAFLGVSLAGMFAGVGVAGRIPDRSLRKIFAWCVVAVAILLAGKNLAALAR